MFSLPQLSEMANLFDFAFSVEWVKAALVLAFFSTGVVVGVFVYLNRFAKKPYLQLWTVAWMFFAAWLAAAMQIQESPDTPFLAWARRACLGICALCMFWGSFELTGAQRRNRRELGFGIVMLLLWSYIAAYQVRDPFWMTMPVDVLLATASL